MRNRAKAALSTVPQSDARFALENLSDYVVSRDS